MVSDKQFIAIDHGVESIILCTTMKNLCYSKHFVNLIKINYENGPISHSVVILPHTEQRNISFGVAASMVQTATDRYRFRLHTHMTISKLAVVSGVTSTMLLAT